MSTLHEYARRAEIYRGLIFYQNFAINNQWLELRRNGMWLSNGPPPFTGTRIQSDGSNDSLTGGSIGFRSATIKEFSKLTFACKFIWFGGAGLTFQCPIANISADNLSGFKFDIEESTGNLSAVIGDGTTKHRSNTVQIQTNTEYIAHGRLKSNGDFDLFLTGVKIGSPVTGIQKAAKPSGENLRILKDPGATHLNGGVYWVKVYAEDLDDSEIEAEGKDEQYNFQKLVEIPFLAEYYDPDNSRFLDTSGNKNHAVISGGSNYRILQGKGIEFAGIDTYLDLGSNPALDLRTCSAFFLIKPFRRASGSGVLLSQGSNISSPYYSSLTYNPGNDLAVISRPDDLNIRIGTGLIVPYDSIQLLGAVFDPAAVQGFSGKQRFQATGSSAASAAVAFSSLRIGKGSDLAGGLFIYGQLYHFVLTPRKLNRIQMLDLQVNSFSQLPGAVL